MTPHILQKFKVFKTKFQNNLLSKSPLKRHHVVVSTHVNYYGSF